MQQLVRLSSVSPWVLIALAATFAYTANPSASHAAATCTDGVRAKVTTPFVGVPYVSGTDVETKFARLEKVLRACNDRRSVFLSVYLVVTKTINAKINTGSFKNRAWMDKYLTGFANAYRDAFTNYEAKRFDNVPSSWKVAFDIAAGGKHLFVQDLLLGMNAHINYDLANTVYGIGVGTGADRDSRYADHASVTGILSTLVDDELAVLGKYYASVYASFSDDLQELSGKVAMGGIAPAREHAWKVAVSMADARNGPTTIRSQLNHEAGGAAIAIAAPAKLPGVITILTRAEAGYWPVRSHSVP